jgi:prepilin-type N-terminal cleavage/methylation domain-containing protein
MIDRIKKLHNSQNGMTLVEVISSIALIGIIAAMMYMVFTTSLLLAVISGDNTNVTWDAGTQMNRVIVDSSEAAGISMEAEVKFKQQAANSVDVPGQLVTTQVSSDKNEATMKTFIPDND